MSGLFCSELLNAEQVTYRGDHKELPLALLVACLTAFCNSDDRMLTVFNLAAICRYSTSKAVYAYRQSSVSVTCVLPKR